MEFKYLLVELIENEDSSETFKPIFVSNDFNIIQLYADEEYLSKDDVRFRLDNKHFNIRKDDESELQCPLGTVIVQYENESRFYRGEVYPRAHIIRLNNESMNQYNHVEVL